MINTHFITYDIGVLPGPKVIKPDLSLLERYLWYVELYREIHIFSL